MPLPLPLFLPLRLFALLWLRSELFREKCPEPCEEDLDVLPPPLLELLALLKLELPLLLLLVLLLLRLELVANREEPDDFDDRRELAEELLGVGIGVFSKLRPLGERLAPILALCLSCTL